MRDDPHKKEIESDWDMWLVSLYPEYFSSPVASHHEDFWTHVWAIQPSVRPRPFIAVWNRGGGKSMSAEAACVALGARNIRHYGLYVCNKQDQADDHLSSIGTMFESEAIEVLYPDHADRALSKYGSVKGWRRNRLRTAGGFTLDALGLDVAARGLKIDEQRPDLIVLDDLDDTEDTALTIERKVRSLTRKILPAGTSDVAIIGIQNLVSNEGVFGQLAGKSEIPCDYLVDRIVSGPIPAVTDMQVAYLNGRWTITAGTPTWEGMDLAACQQFMDTYGLSSFRVECQHSVEVPAGGMYDHLSWSRISWEEFSGQGVDKDGNAYPGIPIDRVTLWVDPAVTKSDTSDSHAIQVDALGRDGILYRLYSWEKRATPLESLTLAFRKALEYGSPTLGVETDQGGDTWKSVFREARQELMNELEAEGDEDAMAQLEAIRFKHAKAGEGHGAKVHRSSRMLAAYEKSPPRMIHVMGTHDVLESALRRFPKVKPHDLCDAAYWSFADLAGKVPAKSLSARGRQVSRSRSPSSFNRRRLIAVR